MQPVPISLETLKFFWGVSSPFPAAPAPLLSTSVAYEDNAEPGAMEERGEKSACGKLSSFIMPKSDVWKPGWFNEICLTVAWKRIDEKVLPLYFIHWVKHLLWKKYIWKRVDSADFSCLKAKHLVSAFLAKAIPEGSCIQPKELSIVSGTKRFYAILWIVPVSGTLLLLIIYWNYIIVLCLKISLLFLCPFMNIQDC